MLTLYPEIEPYASRHIKMEPLSSKQHHEIYVEECGNPNGIPVLFLHGGPGSGCRPQHRCYFDPAVYRVILFDQRGCGRSKPVGELENNSTAFLLHDIETIRLQLQIDRWVLFGGSWGGSLALVYAQHYPQRVQAMILRGLFLGRKKDIDWVYAEGGVSKLFPDAWQRFVGHLPPNQQHAPLAYYQQQLKHKDPQVRVAAAEKLNNWEATIVTLRDHEYTPDPEKTPSPLAHALIQLHFAFNECFIEAFPILEAIDRIRHIPTQVVQGRYDMVCPVYQAWELHQQWPEAELTILPLAGHAAGEAAMVDALVAATRNIAQILS